MGGGGGEMLEVILSVWICAFTACVDARISCLTVLFHLFPLSLFHSVSLSSPRLPLSSLFVPRLGSPHSSFLWEDHVRLFNVSTSFVT